MAKIRCDQCGGLGIALVITGVFYVLPGIALYYLYPLLFISRRTLDLEAFMVERAGLGLLAR